MENISWEDIQEFIKKLNQKTGKNYRLPTEAEWEFAARGGNKSRGYKYSGSNTISKVAWYGTGMGETHPVGRKKSNELGIYDMTGNVFEKCNDWYGEDYYSNSPQNNPQGPSTGTGRVGRGGNWFNNPGLARISYRSSGTPSYRSPYSGFRLAHSE